VDCGAEAFKALRQWTEKVRRFRVVALGLGDPGKEIILVERKGLVRCRRPVRKERGDGIQLTAGEKQRGAEQARLRREIRIISASEIREESLRLRVAAEGGEELGALREEMQEAAAAQEYEKAADLRDVVFALEKTLSPARKFSRTHVPEIPARAAMDALRDALALRAPPLRIECFDISHISGTFVVASMVRFTDGRPDKANYRRFKIKGDIANDDYRAMEQVVGRRYRRLADENKPLPDLVVIDGGRGQVAAALKAFIAADLEPPALVGLAKERETIVFPDARPPLNLPLDHAGLQLVQRIRDEAHRFANTFNADLRSKRIRESVLDEFPGLGPSRRRALLTHFGSIDRLRAASVAEIAETPGFGKRTAEALHQFLSGRPAGRIDPQ
jgi:excinuclease ABC subunit C